jgi:hypothetical protein
MNPTQMQMLCQNRVDSIIDRMHELCAQGRTKDAQALYDEIRDWVVQKEDIQVLSLDYLDQY